MIRILTLLVFFFIGVNFHSCSSTEIKVDPVFNSYVSQFKVLSNGRHSDIILNRTTIIFKSISSLGLCRPYNNEIEINPSYWFGSTVKERLALIYHELGHCVLFRKHEEKRLKDGCPYSIMYHEQTMNDAYCYETHWKHYKKELFR